MSAKVFLEQFSAVIGIQSRESLDDYTRLLMT